MNALVTGAGGFLGRSVVRRLHAEGVRVRAFCRPGGSGCAEADEVCHGDLRSSDDLASAVKGMELVVHAGARVSTTGSWDEFQTTNVDATRTLIRLAVRDRVRRFVHVSSLSVYAVPCDGAQVTEDSGFEPAGGDRGHYARSKLAADQVASEAARTGAPVAIVRPGLLYGPGKKPPLARRAITVGPSLVVFARPDYLLPLAYVDNVADAVYLAATSAAAVGRAYTVVDQHVAQRDYLRLYRSVAGASWSPIFVPVGLLPPAVGAAESLLRLIGRRPPVSRHQIERTIWSATFSTARATAELGWRPRVPLEAALRRSLAPEEDARRTPATARVPPAANPSAP